MREWDFTRIQSLLEQSKFRGTTRAAQLMQLSGRPQAKIVEGEVPKERLISTYTLRARHAQVNQDAFQEIVSALEKYRGTLIRLISISADGDVGGLFLASDDTILALLISGKSAS